jgi:hypothetical protein
MARPQQPELARSAKTDLDPDHVETGLQGQRRPASGGETGPVPPENQPGHHPDKEQDKPDLDAFAARLGTDPSAPSATRARKRAASKATPAKAATRKSASPARTAPRKAPSTPTPGWPESAPAAGDVGPLPDAAKAAAPQPAPDRPKEPRLVGLALFPLRETVKRLDQLERTLTDRFGVRGESGSGDR